MVDLHDVGYDGVLQELPVREVVAVIGVVEGGPDVCVLAGENHF